MKALHSLIALLLLVVIACKQTPKTDTVAEEVKEIVASGQSEKATKLSKETTQSKEQTIEEFLRQLQTAVKNDDITMIEKSLKFPFEFNSGGESAFYDSYQELKESTRRFLRILKAKSIEKEGDMFIITYQDPEDIEYFVDFFAVKDGNTFKLTGFAEPH